MTSAEIALTLADIANAAVRQPNNKADMNSINNIIIFSIYNKRYSHISYIEKYVAEIIILSNAGKPVICIFPLFRSFAHDYVSI